jgi:hypothetical protein
VRDLRAKIKVEDVVFMGDEKNPSGNASGSNDTGKRVDHAHLAAENTLPADMPPQEIADVQSRGRKPWGPGFLSKK